MRDKYTPLNQAAKLTLFNYLRGSSVLLAAREMLF